MLSSEIKSRLSGFSAVPQTTTPPRTPIRNVLDRYDQGQLYFQTIVKLREKYINIFSNPPPHYESAAVPALFFTELTKTDSIIRIFLVQNFTQIIL
jgi:hypothetical protein